MEKNCVKQLIISIAIAGIFSACNSEPKTGNDLAVENARSYLRNNLGADSGSYEEGTWGKVEPHALEFAESNLYRLYRDSLEIMQTRVTRINDSMTGVKNPQSPGYMSMTRRRDDYQRRLEDYRLHEAELRLQYEKQPEYNGYWLQHEYRVKGEPIRVHILLGDTVKYTPSGLIYK